MNAYTTEFFSCCPNNGLRIKYRLRIESAEIIPVEQIIAKVEGLPDAYHEELADDLLLSFGGLQTLVADHHGVTIETTRAAPAAQQAPTGGAAQACPCFPGTCRGGEVVNGRLANGQLCAAASASGA